MKKPNVYVVNRASHDLSAAKKFGDLVFLSENRQDRFATNNMYREFLPLLECSQPNDYLLLTGLTVMNVVAASILAMLHQKLNVLIHNPKNNSYVARTIDLTNINQPVEYVLSRLKIDETG